MEKAATELLAFLQNDGESLGRACAEVCGSCHSDDVELAANTFIETLRELAGQKQ